MKRRRKKKKAAEPRIQDHIMITSFPASDHEHRGQNLIYPGTRWLSYTDGLVKLGRPELAIWSPPLYVRGAARLLNHWAAYTAWERPIEPGQKIEAPDDAGPSVILWVLQSSFESAPEPNSPVLPDCPIPAPLLLSPAAVRFACAFCGPFGLDS